jgi:class 3 adenylate cyclase
MADTIQVQIEKLTASIRALEAQRNLLGDEVVDTSLKALGAQLAALEEQAAAQAIPSEERRLVTILFMDMVGSTSMAEKLDPEEWRQVVSKMHTALGEAITAYHGTIAQYLGMGC